jgi:hypothetical protein
VFSSTDKSGKQNKIIDAIPGKSKPIKNHINGDRPIRLAKVAAINGILKAAKIPREINNAAPILFKYKI